MTRAFRLVRHPLCWLSLATLIVVSLALLDAPRALSIELQSEGMLPRTPLEAALAPSQVTYISTGINHTCALTMAGGVVCWGRNEYSQLGDGTKSDRSTPVDVIGLNSGVQAISAGSDHTCAVTQSGSVKCWGFNESGQVGDGTTNDRSTPVDVTGLGAGVQAVSAGYGHTCAVTAAGGVKCWGANGSGQLGDSTFGPHSVPVDVNGLNSDVLAVDTGEFYTCALTTASGVKCWGANGHGQLGDGTSEQRLVPTDVAGLTAGVQAISVGGDHACALTATGNVQCWGANDFGQLGDGTTVAKSTPVDVSGLDAGVQAIITGHLHTCALTTAGGVKCWGSNQNGQLGDGTTSNRLVPVGVVGLAPAPQAVDAGGSHTCAVMADGNAQCWGNGYFGQLGNGVLGYQTTPSNVPALTEGVQDVNVGGNWTCALTAAGGVKCWGVDRTTPVDIDGLSSGIQAISVGGQHICGLTAAGGVKCWGQNNYGQLGDGTVTTRTTAVDVSGLSSGVKAISAGGAHTCAVTTSGGLKCWGANGHGQLGTGRFGDQHTPVDVFTSEVQAVSAGGEHTCALTAAGGVLCWGFNSDGQVGDGTTQFRPWPVAVTGLNTGVQAIDTADNATCAVTTLGGLLCWGAIGENTQYGTTGFVQPTYVQKLTSGVQAVSVGGSHQCILTGSGVVKCWGSNVNGQLGNGRTSSWTTGEFTPLDKVIGLASHTKVVAAGDSHTCALTAQGGVKCWGSNGANQLGTGEQAAHTTPVYVAWLRAAQITSTPPLTATSGELYSYSVQAAGVPTPTFELLDGPSGMTLNTYSGRIEWTPGVVGCYWVDVAAENGVDPTALQSFSIAVKPAPDEMSTLLPCGKGVYLPVVGRQP